MCNHKRLRRVSWKSYYKARPIRHAESREGEKTEGHDWGWHDPRKPEGEGGLGTCTPAPLFLGRGFTLAHLIYVEEALRPRCPLFTLLRVLH